MNNMIQPPASITIPSQELFVLLQIAKRAPMLDAERLWLNGFDSRLAQALQPPQVDPDAKATIPPEPFDPTTEKAAAKREARRQRRLAERAAASGAGEAKADPPG